MIIKQYNFTLTCGRKHFFHDLNDISWSPDGSLKERSQLIIFSSCFRLKYSIVLCHVSQGRTSCHCFRGKKEREMGPSVPTPFLLPLPFSYPAPTSFSLSIKEKNFLFLHCLKCWGLPREGKFHNLHAFSLHLQVSQPLPPPQLSPYKIREKAPHSTSLSQSWQAMRHFQLHSTKCISQSWKTTHYAHTTMRSESGLSYAIAKGGEMWSHPALGILPTFSCLGKKKKGTARVHHKFICLMLRSFSLPIQMACFWNKPLLLPPHPRRMYCSKDCKTLSKLELLSPWWLILRERNSENKSGTNVYMVPILLKPYTCFNTCLVLFSLTLKKFCF